VKKLPKKRKRILALTLAVLVCVFAIYVYADNNRITVTEITYENEKLPVAFDGFKIVQVSDLHNKKFGKEQSGLLELVKNAEPDIIAVTGDLIKRNDSDITGAMDFIKAAAEIAPVYFVTGNHEYVSGIYDTLRVDLENAGVNVIDNTATKLYKENEYIYLLGLDDQTYIEERYNEAGYAGYPWDDALSQLTDGTDGFSVLFVHMPKLFENYVKADIDLVLAGHMHGGQIRLPFTDGLFAPSYGFFPKHTSGTQTEGNTTMVVSRGLGNPTVIPRIFNPPELMVVTLKSKR